MKKIMMAVVLLLSVTALPAVAQETDFSEIEECELQRWYFGGAAVLVLPEGGSKMRRLGGGAARAGYYLTEFWAVEAEAAALENFAGIAAKVLWHWWGYERLDPFFTFGARGWIGSDNGQVGPEAGAGCFYHLTDSWSLRFDADVTLGIDNRAETVYSLSAGIQYSF